MNFFLIFKYQIFVKYWPGIAVPGMLSTKFNHFFLLKKLTISPPTTQMYKNP